MPVNIANVFLYEEDWAQKVRERLNEPSVWKEICNVIYSDTRVFNLPYLDDFTLQTTTRSSPYTAQAVIQTNETLTINTDRLAPYVIPQADYYQSKYSDFMRLAEQQANQIDANIESAVFAAHTTHEEFDDGDISGTDGTSITLSIANVDDVITQAKARILSARGGELLARNGGFAAWRPNQFAVVEQWAMANGFQFADEVLRNGIRFGFRAGGLSHYVSTQIPSGRAMIGVKKVLHLGILKSTYGVPKFLKEDPGQIHGFGIVSQVSYGTLTPVQWQSLMLDVAVVA